MIGLMPPPPPYRRAISTYIGTTLDTSALATVTLTGVAIGPPAPDRLVVAVVLGRDSNARTISSVTIGGVAATAAVTSPSQNNPTGIYYARVPAGATADIVVTFSAATTRMAVAVYTVTGYRNLTPAAVNQGYGSGTTLSVALARPRDAVVIAGSITSSAGTFAWSGVTEDTDIAHVSSRVSAASDDFGAAEPAMAVSFVNSGSGAASIVAATWT
ncbi:MAG: hypothetical protein LCH61_01220 [Proteobacteria bacterium]|nr:hypothetical protein [Pseudomonadota bacterium]